MLEIHESCHFVKELTFYTLIVTTNTTKRSVVILTNPN